MNAAFFTMKKTLNSAYQSSACKRLFRYHDIPTIMIRFITTVKSMIASVVTAKIRDPQIDSTILPSVRYWNVVVVEMDFLTPS